MLARSAAWPGESTEKQWSWPIVVHETPSTRALSVGKGTEARPILAGTGHSHHSVRRHAADHGARPCTLVEWLLIAMAVMCLVALAMVLVAWWTVTSSLRVSTYMVTHEVLPVVV